MPARETLAQILSAADPPEDPAQFASGYAVCELGEHHRGEHADHLWDCDNPDQAVWFLWTETKHRFVTLRWCPAEQANGDACGLYTDHPQDHTWNVIDPTQEAMKADIAAHPERWGLRREY
ncbi:hypothetical protein [Streptomyces sp. cf386]|uniref:hypothetical protein n=1 Tax=Streptomyces sp. cf386 TaxID=1761904 RepID=UPI00115F9DF5|nr:hypothetical protein [Streptomyces sp. cf386]